MNEGLTVPPSASFYILLQRTDNQSVALSRLLRRVPGRFSLAFAQIEALVRRKHIASRFVRGIRRDFNSIAGVLPKHVNAILDVGCGLAAIDILLSRHYTDYDPVQLYLADFGDTSSRIEYGFGRHPSRYNSLSVANELLVSNHIPPKTIHFISPDDIARDDSLPPLQVVISTLAWGFHFPVETYAQVISSAMAPEGRLILDVRTGTDGIDRLRDYFLVVELIEETEKWRRVVARR